VTFITTQLVNQEDTKELKKVFLEFDVNRDGRLSREELLQGYEKIMGCAAAANKEVDNIMAVCDVDGSGYVDYSEFLSASMNKKTMLSKDNLQAAFEAFDADQNGFITVEEIKYIMGSVQVVDSVWEEVLQEVDHDGNGKIDLGEFVELMLKTF
jgi:calcium-dependent protein kinase